MNRSRVTVPVLVVMATLVALPAGLTGGGPAAASTGTAAGPASPSPDRLQESVLVTGQGEVYGEPDTLAAEFAVETVASTVTEALDSANAASTRMRDALVHGGTARADLQTSNAGISPNRNDDEEITGYSVRQGLTVKIRNLSRAGALMSAAITAGGDAARLNGVSFTIEDDTALLAEARRKAFADARGKAGLYAREAGRPLGRVVRISETTPDHGSPVYAGLGEQDRMVGAAQSVPIEPGRQRLAVTVTVEWALKPATGTPQPTSSIVR